MPGITTATLNEHRSAAWRRPAAGRRALSRVAISIPIRLHLGASGALDARTRDLGAGGVCVSTRSCFVAADLCRVTLTLGGTAMEIGAEGRWQIEVSGKDAFLTGIRFIDLPNEAFEQLWDVVHQQAKTLTRWLLRQDEFAGLDLCDLMELAHVTRIREIRTGGLLYRQGVPDDSIFIVTQGEVVLERRTPRERRLVLGHVGPGGLLGGLGVVLSSPANETAIAGSDLYLLEISRGAFTNLLVTSPTLAFHVASLVTQSHVRRVDFALGRFVDNDR